jgi:hypothetical protein
MSYWDDENNNYGEFGSKNKHVDPSIHIMNKNEKKALRRLKSKTGLSEEELRKEKTNRIILSKAQKRVGSKTPHERNLLSIQKKVTKRLKLPKEHPSVIEGIKEEFKVIRERYWGHGMIKVYSDEVLFHQLSELNKKK